MQRPLVTAYAAGLATPSVRRPKARARHTRRGACLFVSAENNGSLCRRGQTVNHNSSGTINRNEPTDADLTGESCVAFYAPRPSNDT